jgi:hypothetical protein
MLKGLVFLFRNCEVGPMRRAEPCTIPCIVCIVFCTVRYTTIKYGILPSLFPILVEAGFDTRLQQPLQPRGNARTLRQHTRCPAFFGFKGSHDVVVCVRSRAWLASVPRVRERLKTSRRSIDIDGYPGYRFEVASSKVQPIRHVDIQLGLFCLQVSGGGLRI